MCLCAVHENVSATRDLRDNVEDALAAGTPVRLFCLPNGIGVHNENCVFLLNLLRRTKSTIRFFLFNEQICVCASVLVCTVCKFNFIARCVTHSQRAQYAETFYDGRPSARGPNPTNCSAMTHARCEFAGTKIAINPHATFSDTNAILPRA